MFSGPPSPVSFGDRRPPQLLTPTSAISRDQEKHVSCRGRQRRPFFRRDSLRAACRDCIRGGRSGSKGVGTALNMKAAAAGGLWGLKAATVAKATWAVPLVFITALFASRAVQTSNMESDCLNDLASVTQRESLPPPSHSFPSPSHSCLLPPPLGSLVPPIHLLLAMFSIKSSPAVPPVSPDFYSVSALCLSFPHCRVRRVEEADQGRVPLR